MILTRINSIPLYSTTQEAVDHAMRISLKGYHSHVYRGRIGYMPGVNHSSIMASQVNVASPQQIGSQATTAYVPQPILQQQFIQPVVTTNINTTLTPSQAPLPTTSTPSGGSSSGGGGGY